MLFTAADNQSVPLNAVAAAQVVIAAEVVLFVRWCRRGYAQTSRKPDGRKPLRPGSDPD